MRARFLFAAGLFALPALADDPFAMLERMSRSVRTLDYRGTFSYQQGQELSSVRLVHAVVDGKEQERVVHLDGDMREILRHDHDVECVHLGNRLLRLDPDNPAHPAVLGASFSSMSCVPSVGCASSRRNGRARRALSSISAPLAGSTSRCPSRTLNTAESFSSAARSSGPSSVVCTCAVRRTSSGMASLPPESMAT